MLHLLCIPTNRLVFFLALTFGLLGVHIAPNEAVEEIDSLVDVFNSAKRYWNTEVMHTMYIKVDLCLSISLPLRVRVEGFLMCSIKVC